MKTPPCAFNEIVGKIQVLTLEVRTVLPAEELGTRLRACFGAGGLGLDLREEPPGSLLFEGGGASRLERELARAEVLIERAEATDGAPSDLVQSAREALARARQLAAEGQILRALQSSRLAMRLAAQAVAASGETLTADAVMAQIARWDERHADVAEAVAASGSREAAQILTRARHHRDQAQRLVAENTLESALRQVKAAFDLLNEASELAR